MVMFVHEIKNPKWISTRAVNEAALIRGLCVMSYTPFRICSEVIIIIVILSIYLFYFVILIKCVHNKPMFYQKKKKKNADVLELIEMKVAWLCA